MNPYLELLGNDDSRKLVDYFGEMDINEEILGATPLTWAVFMSKVEIIKRLLELGADINKRDAIGRSALQVACYYGYVGIVKQLLHHGAEVDEICFERTKNSWCGMEQVEIVKLLMEQGEWKE